MLAQVSRLDHAQGSNLDALWDTHERLGGGAERRSRFCCRNRGRVAAEAAEKTLCAYGPQRLLDDDGGGQGMGEKLLELVADVIGDERDGGLVALAVLERGEGLFHEGLRIVGDEESLVEEGSEG